MGIVSSIGNDTQEVLASLGEAMSGISRADEYATLGFRCQVHGAPSLDPAETVDRRAMRFLGRGAAWNHAAMEQAIRGAGFRRRSLRRAHRHRRGLGRASTRAIVEAADTTRTKGPSASGRSHAEGDVVHASASLATWSKIRGMNYRFRRPARRRTAASATPPKRSSGASRT